ncbi:MAG: hypothetical protein A2096_01770 [Spirochaetes bacterium GWF1_41_5]|nr:MAG: hypothetical protein A2096_01770 [Spirochaetes bacterium GWF1_41_5]HBE02376.1 hypothetical protein [Spirochaetia bacterium]
MKKTKFIEAHVHMDAWDKKTKEYVRSSGVEQFWVMDTHIEESDTPRHVKKEVILKASQEMPDKIIAFARINWTKNSDQIVEYFKSGFTGLKAIFPPKPYNDPSYYPIYAEADRLKMPVLFHTGIIAHSPDRKKNPEYRGYGPANMEPAFLATIADMFPKLIIIGGHPGFPYTEQTDHNLYYYPNIFHDISGYLPVEWFLKVLAKKTCGYHKGARFFTDKFLFATDHCIGNRESEQSGMERRKALWYFLTNICGRYYTWGDDTDKIFYHNARKLMGKVRSDQKIIRARKNFYI